MRPKAVHLPETISAVPVEAVIILTPMATKLMWIEVCVID